MQANHLRLNLKTAPSLPHPSLLSRQIYERTLDLVAEKLSSEESGVESSAAAAASDFSYSDLISPTNLEIIANLSGCEAHRRRLEATSACEEDLCFQSKFREDGGDPVVITFQYRVSHLHAVFFIRDV